MAQRCNIYADNAATTKLSPTALEAMLPYLQADYGNASQPYSFSRSPKKAIKAAREIIANCIGADPEEIYFTSCGTESDNWVVAGAVDLGLPIVTSAIEHHAMLKPCEHALSRGHKVTTLPVNTDGIVEEQSLDNATIESNGIVSIMYANNEIGTIQPIQTLVKIAHSKGWLFHTDAVQAIGHLPINVHELNVDLMSASAHKFNGPKGIGFLYIRNGLEWPAFIMGGAQEHGLRAGTENVAYIVGMATALQENVERIDATSRHLTELEQIIVGSLSSANVTFRRNGAKEHIPGNISLSFSGTSGEMLLHRLDLMGISVSTGSACDSQNTQISHVLKAISLDDELAKGTIRISLGRDNSEDDVKNIASAIVSIFK